LIIRRYVAREVSQSMIAVLTVLLLIFVSNHFVRILGEVDTGSLQADVILEVLYLRILSAMSILLPLALFLAVLLAFGRLYKDNEAVAMEACGVSPRSGLHAVMGFSLVIALLVGILSLSIVPWSEERIYQIRDEQQVESALTGLVAGRFVEPRNSQGVIYVEQINSAGQAMQNIFIQGKTGEPSRQVILVAESGEQELDHRSGDYFIILHNGHRYEGQPGSRDYRVIDFQRHAIRISEPPVVRSYRKRRAYRTASLMGTDDLADKAEFQWRLATPISTLLLAILAVPLSRTAPRQGKYAKLFVAILVYVVYSNLLTVAQTWVEQETIPASLGLWWVHLGLAALIWSLLVRQYGHGWLLRRLFKRQY